MSITATSPLYRTIRRSILNALGNERTADIATEAIMNSHPHLAMVWEKNTCFACRAVLAPSDYAFSDGLCEFCRHDEDPPEYYAENHRRYGSD